MRHVHLISADARRLPLHDESVQCIVTSPPYWGLRKYAGEQELVWAPLTNRKGSDFVWMCPHEFDGEWGEAPDIRTGLGLAKLGERYRGGGHKQAELCTHEFANETHTGGGKVDGKERWNHTGHGEHGHATSTAGTCVRCGAWKGAYGLEPTIEMYIAHTVEILRELRRVLRKDGVLFLNIGDSYATGGGRAFSPGGGVQGERFRAMRAQVPDSMNPNSGNPIYQPNRMPQDGLKAKDLCLIPERVAMAAQADGWWVRSRIIWAKPNPMPESVTDRPTDSAEHIWMFTKSERYFWDAEAVRESLSDGPKGGRQLAELRGETAPRSKDYHDGRLQRLSAGVHFATRNLRNVWTFATQPYAGAHFATFPEEIPRRCILAATSERGACAQCGAPWERITDSTRSFESGSGKSGNPPNGKHGKDWEQAQSGEYDIRMGPVIDSRTIGWRPTCACDPSEEIRIGEVHPFGLRKKACYSKRLKREWYRRRWQARIDSYWPKLVPCTVLDPFGGSGTTGRVAVELNRSAVIVDLAYTRSTEADRAAGRDYAALAQERTTNVQRRLL